MSVKHSPIHGQSKQQEGMSTVDTQVESSPLLIPLTESLPSASQTAGIEQNQQFNATGTDYGQAGTVMALAPLKLPDFWKEFPAIWFTHVEAQFQIRRITADDTKYFTVISALSANVLAEVSDILQAPPLHGKYEHLKSTIIKRFAESVDRQLHKLLTELELGSDKPSQLLRKMRTLAESRASEELLRTRWLSLLPTEVHRILKVLQNATLDQLAEVADGLLENTSNNNAFVMATNHQATQNLVSPASSGRSTATGFYLEDSLSQDLGEIKRYMAQLVILNKDVLTKIDNLSSHISRHQSRSPARRRSASPSSNNLCFYHRKFGAGARRCTQPCSFLSSGSQPLQEN